MSTPMIAMTTRSSMSVKPALSWRNDRAEDMTGQVFMPSRKPIAWTARATGQRELDDEGRDNAMGSALVMSLVLMGCGTEGILYCETGNFTAQRNLWAWIAYQI